MSQMKRAGGRGWGGPVEVIQTPLSLLLYRPQRSKERGLGNVFKVKTRKARGAKAEWRKINIVGSIIFAPC